MSDAAPQFYIPRSDEQSQIITEAAAVRATDKSRAILLYGPGGTGKTRLVRQLPAIADIPKTRWLAPVDVDDSQHWLLSNLERYVADQLDPERTYFDPYDKYVSELPRHRHAPVNRAAILEHLNRIKAVFTQCYENYIQGTGNTVVMTFDTVEAIRGMYLLRTLTHWMRALPRTLFILAGRPMPAGEDWRDSIRAALEDMEVTSVPLGQFSEENCQRYLAPIGMEAGLDEDQLAKLVHLTQGHPLWLAFTVDYLRIAGLPEEMAAPRRQIERDLPYHGEPSRAGHELAESFKRRLVAPYRNMDFRHETIRRLAVVRESISQPIWLELMEDLPRPAELADDDRAWAALLEIEWIRQRANHRYVTLHDAVAEELAQRVINPEDADDKQRQALWSRAVQIYGRRAAELKEALAEKQSEVDDQLADLAAKGSGSNPESAKAVELIHEVTELDGMRQELNLLEVAHLFYQLLSDFPEGSRQFVTLLRDAMDRHDVLLEDLLAHQIQRFLPGGVGETTLGDTVGAAIRRFQAWLRGEGWQSYLDIGLEIAAYLIDRQDLAAALTLLDQLPVPEDPERLYTLRNLQGNACMRVPRRVVDGGEYFQKALAVAGQFPPSELHRKIAVAQKERGFYYRNIGKWDEADRAYSDAYDAIRQVSSSDESNAVKDREETASILSNWAYVKGIGGKYDEGISFVEVAITIRGTIGNRHGRAISRGVLGEVHRYQRQFKQAWDAYTEAEEVFQELSSWSWLGVIHQEQAICLFQSVPAGVQLLEPDENPADQAEALIVDALELCKTVNVRAYPSALNRAGRIFGSKDPDRGLYYLMEGAERAKELSDGWFWVANLIEYAELCYRAWDDGAKPQYLDLIRPIDGKLQESAADGVEFPELRGRWNVLQGHLAMHEALAGDDRTLEIALAHYGKGFPLITHGWVGSFGVSTIFPGEFGRFRDLALQLPPEARARWRQELRRAWSGQELLLARLEELY
jgi:tetratricopeptide (TPR) repeat protein